MISVTEEKIMYDYLYINEQGLLLTRDGTNIDTISYSYMYVMTRNEVHKTFCIPNFILHLKHRTLQSCFQITINISYACKLHKTLTNITIF